MRTLYFQLHGPLMSFGARGADRNRPTRRIPTRSGVIGLVMGAMGVERDETKRQEKISGSLSLSTLTKTPNRVEEDFHTVRSPWSGVAGDNKHRKEALERMENNRDSGEYGKSTSITQREYVTDTYSRVALSSSEESVELDNLAESLEDPHYLPYLGRRCYPTGLPFSPEVKDNLSLEQLGKLPDDRAEDLFYSIGEGRTVFATELPEQFDRKFRETLNPSDQRIAGTRRFKERKEYVIRLGEGNDVFQ